MTTKSKSRKPRSRKSDPSINIEERIRRRAYDFYEQRGTVDGFALDDWLRAEREILGAQKQRKAEAATQALRKRIMKTTILPLRLPGGRL